MNPKLTLVSHLLCPYVQRAVILLTEKQIPFERIDVDLSNKPDWFLKISPLGKTPVLLVDGQPIFESAVICEYLNETTAARMHPDNPLERARHRGWMEFSSATLNAIGALYAAPDAQTLQAKANDLRTKFAQVETELGSHAHSGPYYAGTSFSVVDACFAPVFRYFDVFDTIEDFGALKDLPRVSAWRTALAQRASVQRAVRVDYPELLRAFLLRRGSEISRRVHSTEAIAR
jgi:glutathione S-transferase